MTDKEIIKALNTATNVDGLQICCIDYENNPKNVIYLSIKSDILDLINRQKAIVEKSEKVQYFADKTIATLQAENKYLNETINNLTNEKDALFDKAEELKAEIERLKTNLNVELENFATEYDNKIKTEAIKEFKNKVENDIVTLLGKSNCTDFVNCLDYRYKEMVGK